ncbi:MAG: 3-dehydroquinate synthase [bacterium]|nr:3-dehydroquinate synthase [bacterium]
MVIDVKSKANDIEYPIIIERDSIKKLNNYFNLDRKVLIITDDGIPRNLVHTVSKQISDVYVYTIEQGEASKNFTNYEKILEFMVNNKFTRTDCIIALGGGVVGDLSGFIANSYMRGIDFYNIPTTLLSEVDSSIGGKCAIDFMNVKNNIGCFKFPKAVLIDSNTLETLDIRQFNSGMAEVIKMSMTFNKDLFNYLKETKELDIDYVISEALKLKADVVEKDPFERDLRKVLNFGHTIGHAVESLSEGSLLHGECVAIGMTYMVSNSIKAELLYVLEKYNLPVTCEVDTNKVIDLIKVDKKASSDNVTIVYVEKVGSYEFRKIKIDSIKDYLK